MKKLLLFLLLFPATLFPAEHTAGLSSINWLAGCWTGTGETQYAEQWMAPAGGIMLGMSRTIRPGKTTLFEFICISEEGGKLYYTAKPSNQPEAKFALSKSGPLEVVFENPKHDFPQRIVYRLNSDGSLLARIEGKDRAVDFPMKRAQCAGETSVCSAE